MERGSSATAPSEHGSGCRQREGVLAERGGSQGANTTADLRQATRARALYGPKKARLCACG